MDFGDWYRFQHKHVLYDFQKELLADSLTNQFVAVLGSRQIGKTRYLAILALMLSGGISSKGGDIPPHDVFVISATYSKSLMVIKEINLVLDELNIVRKIDHDVLGGKTEIVLKNGRSILALAGKPGCLQGHAGSCLWDEASLTEHDPADIYTQVLAASSSKDYFRVVMCTNADRQGSWVWEFFESQAEEFVNTRKEFKVHNINIYQAYPNGLPERIETRRKMLSSAGWKRFFLNQFVSGDAGRFEGEHINRALMQTFTCNNGLRVLSIDPGFSKKGHPAGIVVTSIVNGHVDVLHSDLWFGLPEEEQRAKIRQLVTEYRISRILIDQGVGGMIMRDNLIKQYGPHMIVPVSVSRNKYNLWSTELEKLMSEGKLRIRPDQKFLIEDLKCIEVDKRNNVVVTERAHTNGTNKIHYDSAVALMFVTDHVGGQLGMIQAEEVELYDTYDTVFGIDNYDKFI